MGKTIAIDENTRYKPEFVRMKIACMNIYEVPESAESSLGMFLYDFIFELEELETMGKKGLRAETKTRVNDTLRSPKKPRTDNSTFTANKSSGASVTITHITEQGCSKNAGGSNSKQNFSRLFGSAPRKLYKDKSYTNHKNISKLREDEIEAGEVIPAATYEPSKDMSDNENSDTSGNYANQVSQVFGDKENTNQGNRSLWLVRCPISVQEDNVVISKADKENEMKTLANL